MRPWFKPVTDVLALSQQDYPIVNGGDDPAAYVSGDKRVSSANDASKDGNGISGKELVQELKMQPDMCSAF
jgi:hypothetical protein